MVPTEHEGDTQSYAVGTLASGRVSPGSIDPLIGNICQQSDGEAPQPQRIGGGTTVISIGLIDEKSLTRQCITSSLQALDDRLDIVSFPTCDDCLQHMRDRDLILYHAHEAAANWDHNDEKSVSFKKLLNIVPVIILSDLDCPDSLIEIFQDGARGFISTTDTTLEQLIEIIGLVRV